MKTKTIKERSYDYTIQREGICNPSTLCSMREAYEDGATEQKVIDDAELAEVKRQRDAYYDELTKLRRQKVEIIDKACEWLSVHWRDYVATDGDGVIRFGGWEGDFRKAMEE